MYNLWIKIITSPYRIEGMYEIIGPFDSSSKGDVNQFPTLALVTAASISFLR